MRFFIYFFRFFLLCILTGLVLTSLVVRWFAFGLDLKAKGGTLLSTNLQHVTHLLAQRNRLSFEGAINKFKKFICAYL
jgi:hypothetical protein